MSKSFALNTESFIWVMYNLFSRFVEKSWQLKMIESFIIASYDWVNIHGNLNEAWPEMSYEKSWNPEKIPSTQCALHLHVMKAFLLLRQKHDMAKVKTILLVISMRHLRIMEHYFLHRYFSSSSFHALTRAENTSAFPTNPVYSHGKRWNVFL